jgi:RNA polymerase sigma-70 factor (ECF subfamily)
VIKTDASPQYIDVSESDRPPGVGLDDFDAIYHRELAYVWKTLGRLGVASADLDDATHDVFVVLHRKWDSIDPARPIRAWLFGVARRVAATRRRNDHGSPIDSPEPSAGGPEPIARRDLLWKALAALDDDRREVVVLHDVEGHTSADIGAMLGIPANTVRSRLRLGRAQLVAAVERLEGKP